MGSPQNYGPILVPVNNRCRNIFYNQNRLIILRTTHIENCLGFSAEDAATLFARADVNLGSGWVWGGDFALLDLGKG